MKPVITLCVLAGGFGTRLRSAVADVPKPLAPVASRPYLDYLIDHWIAQGVTEIALLLHHQATLVEAFVQSQRDRGRWRNCVIRSVTESIPLGTGGAIANAVRQGVLTDSFLVANADTWLGSGIETMVRTRAPAMAVIEVPNCERYEAVKVERNRVTDFTEKQRSSGSGWVNAGLYHLQAQLFDDWNGQAFSLERDLFPQLVGAGRLQAAPLATQFIDIGVPEDYFRFCRWIESGTVGAL